MPQPKGSSVISGRHYKDAPAAIEWLCQVFGFEKHAVYPGPNNTISHAELTLGGGMIMLGSASNTAHGFPMKQPAELGGMVTETTNLIVADADEVYARAKAAGAKIVDDIEDKHYGGRGFSCADPEGFIWNVGSYDPWQPK